MWYTKRRKNPQGGDGVSSEAYEILALFMRYVFVFIGGLIVWRSFRWLLKDHRAYRREMKSLPDAGLVGEMVNLRTEKAYPLPREGTIGSSRECDIRVKGSGVERRHARFEFVDGKGLKVIPFRGCKVSLGDMTVRNQGYALHGTQLRLGGAVLRVRLFAGLNVPRPADYPPEDDAFVDATPENLATPSLGFSTPGALAYDQQAPRSQAEQEAFPSAKPTGYDGHYTDDGEMTWQYAYSLEELHQAMEEQPWNQASSDGEAPDDGDEEGIPYQSPLAGRRRRRNRHG